LNKLSEKKLKKPKNEHQKELISDTHSILQEVLPLLQQLLVGQALFFQKMHKHYLIK